MFGVGVAGEGPVRFSEAAKLKPVGNTAPAAREWLQEEGVSEPLGPIVSEVAQCHEDVDIVHCFRSHPGSLVMLAIFDSGKPDPIHSARKFTDQHTVARCPTIARRSRGLEADHRDH